MKFYLFIFSVILYSFMGLVTGASQAQACPMEHASELESCEQTKSLSPFESITAMHVTQQSNTTHNITVDCSTTSHMAPCVHASGNLCCSGGAFQPVVFTLPFGTNPILTATKVLQYLDSPSSAFSFHPEGPYRPPVFAA